MTASHHSINLRVPQASLLALLSTAESITITPSEAQAKTLLAMADRPAIAPAQIINPAELPRRFLDAHGNETSDPTTHVITHFHTCGLMFDIRKPSKVRSLAEAREAAAQVELLGRKGDWVVGEDYETQLLIDRAFHAPAACKRSFPNLPSEGLVYTNRPAAWSQGHVWFVYLYYGYVCWYDDDLEGLVVPVLRVPASQ